jgi:hypothetical protein
VRATRERPSDAASRDGSRLVGPGRIVGAIAAVVVTAALGAAPYVGLYVVRPSVSPVGSDSPTYVWRTRLVAASGVSSLADASPFDFHANTSNADRPGSPTLGSLLSIVGVTPWRFVFLEPALAAALLALAAGAFGVLALREPMWAFPIFGLAAAWSPQLAVVANGYLDNALVDGVLVAAAAAALAAAAGRRTLAAAVALVVGAWWVHWIFAAFLVAVVAAAAVLELPRAIARRRDAPLRASSAARLGAIAGASLIGAGVASWLAPALPQMFAGKSHAGYEENLSRQTPFFRIPVFGAVAAGGAAALGLRRGDRGPRVRALVFLVVWLLPALAGWIAFEAGATIPFQRLLGFALPLPLLGAEALVALIRLAARSMRAVGAVAACVVAAAALAGTGALAWQALDRTTPIIDGDVLARTELVMRYLSSVAGDRPVVFVADGRHPDADYGGIPAFRRIRASAPADLVERIAVYVGEPGNLLRGRATRRANDPAFGDTSALYLRSLRPILARDPIVIALAPYYERTARLARDGSGSEIGDGIVVIRGPRPTAALGPPRNVSAVPASALIVGAALAVAVLLVAGSGWSVAAVDAGALERAALAPTLGVVALIATGILWSRAGGALTGSGGALAVLVTAAAGWVLAGARPLRRRGASRGGGVVPAGE